MAGGSAFPNSNYNQSQGNPFSQGYGAPPPQNQMAVQVPPYAQPMAGNMMYRGGFGGYGRDMGGFGGGLIDDMPGMNMQYPQQYTPFNPQFGQQNQGWMQQAHDTRNKFEQSDAYKNYLAKQQALQQEFEGSDDFKNYNTQMKQYEADRNSAPQYDTQGLQNLQRLSGMLRGIQF